MILDLVENYLRTPMPTPFLGQPHPFERSLSRRLKRALAVGFFIAAFLGVFQPFGLGTYPEPWTLASGYGLVTLFAMVTIDVVLLLIRPDPERWTLGRELLSSTVNILLIGLLNAVYSTGMGIAAFSLVNIGLFTLYTFAVGVFPKTAIVLIGFQRKKTHFAKESETINMELREVPHEVPQVSDQELVVLEGENQNEQLQVSKADLLFLKASDNYVEVFHRKKGVERVLLRGSLRSFEDQLEQWANFLRCHKSYIVNLDQVERVSGNAQGLRLHLEQGAGEVPVSRALTAEVRQRLTVHPGTASHSSQILPASPNA